jgi:hypothetical protein
MKKLISKDYTVDPNTEFIPISDTFEHLQEAYGEALDAIMTNLVGGVPAGGYIMNGCVNTIAGPSNSISAGNIYYFLNAGAWSNLVTYGLYDFVSIAGIEYVSLSAGNLNNNPSTTPTSWARVGLHLTGQIFQVPAVVLNPLVNVVVAKIVPTFRATDPTLYTDGSSANVHCIFQIQFFDALTGTGISDFSALNTIPEKWTTPNLAAHWTCPTATVKFRKNKDGMVTIKGLARGTNAAGGTIFTLPVGYRPLDNLQVASGGLSGVILPAHEYLISISNAGVVSLNEIADYVANFPNADLSLTNINFYID